MSKQSQSAGRRGMAQAVADTEQQVLEDFEVSWDGLDEAMDNSDLGDGMRYAWSYHLARISKHLRLSVHNAITTHAEEARQAVDAVWQNPFTRHNALRTVCSVFTHVPALTEHPTRHFWSDALDASDEHCDQLMAGRIPIASIARQMPNIDDLMQYADNLRHETSKSVSRDKLLLDTVTLLPPMQVKEMCSICVRHAADEIPVGENSIIVYPDGTVELLLQDFPDVEGHGPLVRTLQGKLAASVRDSLRLWPRNGMFEGDKVSFFHNESAFSMYARKLLSRVRAGSSLRGLRHACASKYVCMDPGPYCTPETKVRDLATQLMVTPRALHECIKDYGPEMRVNPPPDMPWAPMAELAVPRALATVQELHGAGVDLSTLLAAAANMDHSTIEGSMGKVLLQLIATVRFLSTLQGLGNVLIVREPRQMAPEPGKEVIIAQDGRVRFSQWEEDNAPQVHVMPPDTGQAVLDSLQAWPRDRLFVNAVSGAPLRKNLFHSWAKLVMCTSLGTRLTWYGVRCAWERRP